MALKQPQIKELARRMAMLNIEPEHLQKQIAPSLGLGDLSAPTAQAPNTQVAGGGDFAPNQWSQQGAMTLQEQVQAQTAQRRQMESNEKGKSSEVAPTSTTTAKPGATSATPSLGNLMVPKDPMRSRAPVAPPPQQAPASGGNEPWLSGPWGRIGPFTGSDEANAAADNTWEKMQKEQAARLTPGTLQVGQVPDNVGNAGEARTLAEGTESQKQIMNEFEQSLRAGSPEQGIKGLTNPYAIAAMMATATHESAFAPANVFGTWNDPSEGGVAGKSGGAMSWRDARYTNMQNFGAKMGDNPNHVSARNQALFALQEDPNLINQIENSKDAAEAQQHMNNAWKFAGYDKPGGEGADRIATAQKLVPIVQTPDTGMLSSVAPTQEAPPPQQVPNGGLLSQPINGDGRYTAADVDPTVTATPAADPLTQFPPAPAAPAQSQTFQDKINTIGKLGQLAGAMKGPALEPPKGTAPAPSQGSFNRDPNALKAIMAMLTNMGQSGGPPSLGMLMGGK